MQVDVAEIGPVLGFYLALYEDTAAEMALSEQAGPYFSKAQRFRWPVFFGFVLAGYAAGIVIAGAILRAAHGTTGLGDLAMALLIGAMSTYLVWFPAFMRVRLNRGGIRAYQYSEGWLSAADGSLQVDLSAAKVKCCMRSGIGYHHFFISVAPASGPRVDLLMPPFKLEILTRRIETAGITVVTEPPLPAREDQTANPQRAPESEPIPIPTGPVENPFL